MANLQVIEIKKGEQTIYVGLVNEMTIDEYHKKVAEAESYQKKQDEEKKTLMTQVQNLEKKCEDLMHEIKKDRGEE